MPEAPPKIRRCTAEVKDDTGALLVCDTVIPRGQPECKNRANHLLPFETGFCNSGFHEGMRAKGANGKPAKVCEFWKRCPCQCHKDLDELYSMSGMPRVAQENPDYHPPVNTFVVPSPEERILAAASSSADDVTGTVVVESPAPEVVPPTIRRAFAATPTGRAGRGELELWVKEACDEWAVEKYGTPCTPGWVADWIIKNKGVATQSQGAINAVFERWVKLGFAVIEKKPTRFTKYTDEGVRLGLDAMRQRARDQARRKASAADRGIR